MRRAFDRLFLVLAGLLVCGVAMISSSTVAMSATTRCVLTNNVVSKTAVSNIVVSSISYAEAAGTRITKIKLKKEGCIVVMFSSEANTATGEQLLVRAVLDNAVICGPGEVIFAASPGPAAAAVKAMNFICRGVAAGTHDVRMELRSVGGGQVYLGFRNTIAQW